MLINEPFYSCYIITDNAVHKMDVAFWVRSVIRRGLTCCMDMGDVEIDEWTVSVLGYVFGAEVMEAPVDWLLG